MHFRQFGHRIRQVSRDDREVDTEFLQNRQNDAILLFHQRPQQMLRRHLGIPLFLCVGLSRLKGLLALQRQLVKTNHDLNSPMP